MQSVQVSSALPVRDPPMRSFTRTTALRQKSKKWLQGTCNLPTSFDSEGRTPGQTPLITTFIGDEVRVHRRPVEGLRLTWSGQVQNGASATSEQQLSEILSEFARTMLTDFPIQRILDELVRPHRRTDG